jgi:uncharacterized membrane protein
MSMAGAAASRVGWSRSRILSAVLAVSLVLNVLFVAGAVWSRIEEPPARSLDQRFERIGGQMDLDAAQRVAFDRFIAEMRARRDKVQRQVVPIYRSAWDAAGKPAMDGTEVAQLFEEAYGERLRLNRETTARMIDFLQTLSPGQRGRFVTLARDSWRK